MNFEFCTQYQQHVNSFRVMLQFYAFVFKTCENLFFLNFKKLTRKEKEIISFLKKKVPK